MSQTKVLIVDDARFIRDHVSRIVRDHFPEYHIDAAEDGEAGRKLMSGESYDLILCDWEMPGMSGLELLQWARQQSSYNDVPFVMITSRGERDYVLKAIQAGVNDYMGKPFEDLQLVEKIKKYVGGLKPVQIHVVKPHRCWLQVKQRHRLNRLKNLKVWRNCAFLPVHCVVLLKILPCKQYRWR